MHVKGMRALVPDHSLPLQELDGRDARAHARKTQEDATTWFGRTIAAATVCE